MAETRLTLVDPENIDEAWLKAAPFLLPAIQMGDELTPEQVRDGIASGDMQLAVFENGSAYLAMVTDGVTYPNGRKTMRILHAGGRGLDAVLADGMAMIQGAARASGCCAVELIGRDGWLKKLADYGFRKKAIWMECEING